MQSEPSLNLNDPSGNKAEYDEFINEDIFKILKIENPVEGKWNYEINGDAVFIYDILDSLIVEPYYSIYTSGAVVPLKIDISGLFAQDTEVNSSDFEVSCSIRDPGGTVAEDIKLVDNGKDSDELKGDGIFSGLYNNTDLRGNYLITFKLKHLPTNSTSNKNINAEVTKLPVKISIIEPQKESYLLNEDINVSVELEQVAGSQKQFNLSDYEISFNILYPDGKKAQNIMLLDSGTGADVESGDGIFSSLIAKPQEEGKYTLEFFIRHIPSMIASAATTQKVSFEVKTVSDTQVSIEEELPVKTDTAVQPGKETKSEQKAAQEFPLYLLIVIIASSAVAVAAIFLMVYFLYIKPKRRGF